MNQVLAKHNPNYKALYVSWNDNQRQQGSCFGSNITDARLKGKAPGLLKAWKLVSQCHRRVPRTVFRGVNGVCTALKDGEDFLVARLQIRHLQLCFLAAVFP